MQILFVKLYSYMHTMFGSFLPPSPRSLMQILNQDSMEGIKGRASLSFLALYIYSLKIFYVYALFP
jgi:hypothetical protein